MIFYSDRPDLDFERYDAKQREYEESLPHCDCCEVYIDDQYFEIDGYTLCLDCVIAKYGRSVQL